MRVDKALSRLSRKLSDRRELDRFARDVGHELPRRRLENLRELRRGVAAILTSKQDEFTTGYLAAVVELVTASEAALESSVANDELVQAATRERHWERVLTTIDGGYALPSEIAAQLKMDQGAVSRVLTSLREAGLVERYTADDSQDARTKPHALSLKGESVLAALKALPQQVLDALQLSTIFFSLLRTQGRVHEASFERIARRVDVTHWRIRATFDYLTKSAVDWCQAWKAQGHYLPSTSSEELLSSALTSGETPHFMLEMMKYAPPTDVRLLVRSADTGLWNQFLATPANRYRGAVALDYCDFEIDDAIPEDRPTVILFDNVRLFTLDSHDQTVEKRLKAIASKFCLAAREDKIPEGVRPLPLAA